MDARCGDGDGNGFCFPYDVLLDILRRLPGGAIAACQCVCRAWRAIIDAHDLSLERYFPRRAFPGIFITKIGCRSESAFFGPPLEQGRRRVSTAGGKPPVFQRPVFWHGWATVHHSCNGLLLLMDDEEDRYVCNPATVRCAPLPCSPWAHRSGNMFLAFDPAVSLHYEVFSYQQPPKVFSYQQPPKRVDLHQPYISTRLFGEEHLSKEEEKDGSMHMEEEVNESYFFGLFGEEQLSEEEEQDGGMHMEEQVNESYFFGLFGEEQLSKEEEQDGGMHMEEEVNESYFFGLFGEEQLSGEEEQDGSMHMEEEVNKSYLFELFGEETGEFGSLSDSDELEQKSPLSPSSSDMLVEESLSTRRPEEGEVPPPEQLQEDEPKEKVVHFNVYSSRTGKWGNRKFTPGRCAPGHLYDLVTTPTDSYYKETVWSSEYWRGSLYMHCHNSVLMILRASEGNYDMIGLPGEPCGKKDDIYSLPKNSVLASYERGIHYVAINLQLQLRVWMLSEWTDGQLGWTLAHEANLSPHCHMLYPLAIQPRATWKVLESGYDDLVSLFVDNGESICSEKNCEDDMSDDENYDTAEEEDEDEVEELRRRNQSKYFWDSDEDNFLDVARGDTYLCPPAWGDDCRIMGFHPYKREIFLLIERAVVAYHLDTSRMQYLGEKYELMKDYRQQARCVYGSFPYRPCYVDVLPTRKPSVSP